MILTDTVPDLSVKCLEISTTILLKDISRSVAYEAQSLMYVIYMRDGNLSLEYTKAGSLT